MTDPRNNADDAYAAFMSMPESEWQGLLRSLLRGGVLQVEEDKGFRRALAERKTKVNDQPTVPDYSGEETVSSDDAMKRLTRLVLEMGRLEIEKEETEEKLEAIQKQLRDYSENLVPTLMTEIGTDLFRSKETGLVVELREEVRASFPKDEQKRERAFAYLKQTGDDGLIKREFSVRYGRDAVEWADKFREELKKLGVEEHATVEEDWSINHQSMLKYLREKLREGANVPMGDFGAFVQTFAKIKRGR